MKKFGFFSLFLFLAHLPNILYSFPSSVFWTVCTTDVLPTGVANFQVANYFTAFNGLHHGQFFAPDVGLTFGLFDLKDWKAEAGIDYLGGLDYPFYFNGKIGITENKLFCNAPSFSIGIFDVGTRAGVSNLNVVHSEIGKTLPDFLSGGRLFFGGFVGSRTLGRDRGGFMIAYIKTFFPAKDCDDIKYTKLWLVADYATGKNFLGGGGVGITYFFTPTIFVITGPTFFNDSSLNGRWKWTVQIDIFFRVFKTHKKKSSNQYEASRYSSIEQKKSEYGDDPKSQKSLKTK